jgi:hypothetical protein
MRPLPSWVPLVPPWYQVQSPSQENFWHFKVRVTVLSAEADTDVGTTTNARASMKLRANDCSPHPVFSSLFPLVVIDRVRRRLRASTVNLGFADSGSQQVWSPALEKREAAAERLPRRFPGCDLHGT